MQFLANWLHKAGEDWRDRVTRWVTGSGCDAWIIQREVSGPVEYVHLWPRDAAEGVDPRRAAASLDWFDAQKVEAVGFGLVTLRANGHADPLVRVEDLRQPVEPPLGAQVSAWFDRQAWLRSRAGRLLEARYRRAEGLRLTQDAVFGEEDWDVQRQVLALADGLRWTEEVDPLVLALVSGADGTVPLRDQLAVLAAAYDTPPAVLLALAGPIVAHLVERGVLLPAS